MRAEVGERRQPGSRARSHVFRDRHLKDSETESLGHFLHSSWLTKGCLISWKPDTQKESSPDFLLTASLLYTLRMMEQWEDTVWTSLGPRCPDPPGPAGVNSSESRDRKQPWLPFYPTSCSTLSCQKHRPIMDYAIQHLPWRTQNWNSREPGKPEGNRTPFGLPGWGIGSQDFPSAPQPDQESFLPLGYKTHFSLLHPWEGGVLTWCTLLGVTWNDSIDALESLPAHCSSPHGLFALSKSAPNKLVL